jgi:UDP-2-acetamido-3-amino-2,3-dideoxy-glucuronate N-acetyltransferase
MPSLSGKIINSFEIELSCFFEELIMAIDFYIHPTSDVSPNSKIGHGTKIWQNCQVRENAQIGTNCILSKGVYIDVGVIIGNNVKIQNGISVYHGVTLEDGVFCGPHCVFTNDKRPRSINPDGTLKGADDWKVSETLVKKGASIGAHATIICDNTIGEWAMIGAGAVVTKDIPDFGLVIGNPAKLIGFVCPCGEKLNLSRKSSEQINLNMKLDFVMMNCPKCGMEIKIPFSDYEKLL